MYDKLTNYIANVMENDAAKDVFFNFGKGAASYDLLIYYIFNLKK